MSGPSLLFVEVSSTGKVHDKKARHAIQKHVMRDTATERRRQSKLKREKNQDLEDMVSVIKKYPKQKFIPKTDNLLSDTFLPSLVFSPVLGGGRLDPFDQYPIKMDLEKLFLIDYVYTSPNPTLRPFRDTWLPLSKSDPAFFYEVLSHISQETARLRLGDPNYVESLRYHSLAIQSVNNRLADPVEGVSDGIIGTILAFASFGHSKRDFTSYSSHMEGLMTIIKIRGGVHKIDHNRILRLLLAGANLPTAPKRFLLDVVSSCFLGIAPCFTPPSIRVLQNPSSEIPWPIPIASVSKLWDAAFPMFPNTADIATLFTDLCITIMTIKSELTKRLLWQDLSFLTEWVDPLVHRYLSAEVSVLDQMASALSPSTNTSEECREHNTRLSEQTVVVEGCRMASLILLAKIRRKFLGVNGGRDGEGKVKLVSTKVETENLRWLIEGYRERWTVMKSLLLWAMMFGAMETLESEGDGEWYVGMLKKIMVGMGLERWEEVVIRVNGFLWVGDLLDGECIEVGRRVMLLF